MRLVNTGLWGEDVGEQLESGFKAVWTRELRCRRETKERVVPEKMPLGCATPSAKLQGSRPFVGSAREEILHGGGQPATAP